MIEDRILSLLDNLKIKLEIDKNGYNPLKIMSTIFNKVISRLKNEITEMYLFEMEFQSKSNLVLNENINILNVPEKLFDFAKKRAVEDKSCIEEKYIKQINERFKNHDFCYAVELEGMIVATIFVSKKNVYSTAVNYLFVCPPHTCAIYDVYTLSEYRNRGYIKKIYNFAFQDLKSKGLKKCWIWFMPHNLATLMTHKKVGFRKAIRKITLVQKFGLRWHRIEQINLAIDDLIEISKAINENEN